MWLRVYKVWADNGQILISDVVYASVEDFIFGRLRGPFPVKGRKNPVTVYEISNSSN